ncbi:MAG: hypothetical protein LKE46_15280 [Clostridium sp.]|nr:hypothetical protein [Clostridium sp.]MCI1716917.1 hypothetical protein [Clostridium sp.]MCI1801153.1 hypothetical protein [Clostridium sp.]MCI1815103.1 hypothetical protein [Clostridium sp.]MCI1872006.1 hypothetical protein [Clostridium sp.]
MENETFPYMFYVDNQCSKPKCSYCSKDAVYILKLKP